MSKKSPLLIQVTSNGQKIGKLDPTEFMKAVGAPSRMFLAEIVEKFNAHKAQMGEPERVSVVLA